MPKIFHVPDVGHSTTAQTTELNHGKRKQLSVPVRLRQRWETSNNA
ncbi:hypothetical protein [Loigolactobacillus rennini]|nr:hypothetical protein [Loigolactobacillus rennini]